MGFGTPNTNSNITEIQEPIRYAVGTTAVAIDPSKLDSREGVTIWANKDIYIGVTNLVTTSDKYIFKVFAGQLVQFSCNSTVDLYAISATASVGPDDVLIGQFK